MPTPPIPSRRTRSARSLAGTLLLVAITVLAAGSLTQSAEPSTPGKPCLTASPAVGSPTASPEASPPAACATPSAVVGLGTPAAAGELTVTVTAGSGKAGPIDLTITVQDLTGAPVTDATVTIRHQSLEMDHGVSTRSAEAAAPGEYVAENVPMGMGGRWLVEVTIERPGQTAVVIEVELVLEGP